MLVSAAPPITGVRRRRTIGKQQARAAGLGDGTLYHGAADHVEHLRLRRIRAKDASEVEGAGACLAVTTPRGLGALQLRRRGGGGGRWEVAQGQARRPPPVPPLPELTSGASHTTEVLQMAVMVAGPASLACSGRTRRYTATGSPPVVSGCCCGGGARLLEEEEEDTNSGGGGPACSAQPPLPTPAISVSSSFSFSSTMPVSALSSPAAAGAGTPSM